MKTIKILMVFLVMITVTASGAFAAGTGKIGYVDLSLLFDEYHKTKAYDKELEARHSELEKIGKEKIEKIKESEGKLALMKEGERQALEEEILALQGEATEFVQQEQTNLTKDRNEKIREILLEIENVVSDYAEKEGYDIILNDRVLIYGDQAKNITEEILAILNQ